MVIIVSNVEVRAAVRSTLGSETTTLKALVLTTKARLFALTFFMPVILTAAFCGAQLTAAIIIAAGDAGMTFSQLIGPIEGITAPRGTNADTITTLGYKTTNIFTLRCISHYINGNCTNRSYIEIGFVLFLVISVGAIIAYSRQHQTS